MTGIIIQSRLGSTRLPRKALLPIAGKPMIAHVVDRCLETDFPVVLAVPDGEEVEFEPYLLCQKDKGNFWIYGGHPTDVLDRYYEVAKAFNFDPIIRITGDCPLIDPEMIKAMVGQFKDGYLSNCHPIRTVPKGMDIEVFDLQTLKSAFMFANPGPEREHVTPYIYYHLSEECSTYSPPFPDSWSTCIDTQEDYERVKAMIEEGKYPWLN